MLSLCGVRGTSLSWIMLFAVMLFPSATWSTPAIHISPAAPTTTDSVLISIGGWFPDLCWQPVSVVSWQRVENQIEIQLRAVDVWEPGIYCLLVIRDYSFGFPIGPLPEGTYNVLVTEEHISLRDPLTQYAVASFDVRGRLCGDANGDGAIDIADPVFLLNYIFAGGPAPQPLAQGDADCSRGNVPINIADAVVLINYIFSGGPAPCAVCK